MYTSLSHVHTHSFTLTHLHTLFHTHSFTHAWTYTHSCMCTRVHTRSHTHTCTHREGEMNEGEWAHPCAHGSLLRTVWPSYYSSATRRKWVSIPASQGTRSRHMSFLSPVPRSVFLLYFLPYSFSQATKTYLDSRRRWWQMQRCGVSRNRHTYDRVPTPKAKGPWGRGDRKTVRARGSGSLL